MNIWANHITNLTDGRYFAAYNAAWISFCFNPESPDCIAQNVAAGIAGWLEGPQVAGSFGVKQSDEFIKNTFESLGLQAVVLNIEHDSANLKNLPILLEVSSSQLGNEFEHLLQLTENNTFAKGFILTIDKISWNNLSTTKQIAFQALKQATQQVDIYLKLDLTADDLPLIAQELPHLQGIVLQGGEEEAVGVKSFDDLDDIMAYFD